MTQPESTNTAKKSFSPDWFVRGILSRLGEAFDQFTGRSWKPSSNLATSQLIEKLKALLDSEARDLGGNAKVVPHHIKLKMQWDKFSTDAEQSLKKLEIELLTAAIDHINDLRYHTYAPLQLEIKPDYFTEGVKLSASFDEFAEERESEPEVNVTLPDLKNIVIPIEESEIAEPEKEIFTASFVVNNQLKQVKLAFLPKERKIVGRTKESDLRIDDSSVSKLHAALVLNADNQIIVGDTGSTNGTFVNDERIAYGKAVVLSDLNRLKFGTVEVELKRIPFRVENTAAAENLTGENDLSQNEFATKVDFPTDKLSLNAENSSAKEIALPPMPANDFKTNVDFPKETVLTVNEQVDSAQPKDTLPNKLTEEEL